MSLDNFKEFVRNNSSLQNFVKGGDMTWQRFYELYDLYGPTHDVWNKYLGITSKGASSFKDIFGMLKNINMNDLQKGIGSLQKGISYVQEFIGSRTSKEEIKKDEYEPRPIYKYFDD